MAFLHSTNTFIHIACGAIALFIGLFSLFSRKGGALHRRAGRLLLPFAAVVCASAMAGLLFDASRPALVAISISATYQFISGMRTLRRRNKPPTLPDNLIALCGLGLALAFLWRMQSGTASFPPAMGYSALGFVASLSLYDLLRNAWYGKWGRRIWPIDHGLKMTGFYFAMLAAAAGNLLRDFQPWSQILPTSLGMLVLLLFAGLYFRKSDTSPLPAPTSSTHPLS